MREMGKAGYMFMGLLILAFVALVIVFGLQTYALVAALFPSDNQLMIWATVFSFDGCCVIFAGMEMFYIFHWKHGSKLAGIMWAVTFGGSLLCTVAYMNLSSDHLLHEIVNTSVLIWCYVLVTLVFSGDIVAITWLLKNEWFAYLDRKYGASNKSIGRSDLESVSHDLDEAIAAVERLKTQLDVKSIGHAGGAVQPGPLGQNGNKPRTVKSP